MRFSRTKSATGNTQYVAEGESHRFAAERTNKTWTLTIHHLETVAGIRVAKSGLPYSVTNHDTLTLCKTVADEFEALGDTYQSAGFGHRERVTEASNRAYGVAGAPSAIISETATADTNEGEIMADTKNDINTSEGERVVEEIESNIERVTSLAESANDEGVEELGKETEELISSLSGKGSIALKKSLRANLTAAAHAQPKAVEIKEVTYDEFEGVTELVNMGAEKIAEGVRAHAKASTIAREIAQVTLDMWRRLPNKDGVPDLMGDGDVAKKAAGDLYRLAGESFEEDYETVEALKKLQRAVQWQRTDVRAAYLRSLDFDTPESVEEREKFAKVLEGKPGDVTVSRFLAGYFDTALLGQTERKSLTYHAKQGRSIEDLPENLKELAAYEPSIFAGEDGEAEVTSPDERVASLVKKLTSDVRKAKPEDFENASEETKEKARKDLEELHKAIKDMITATL